ncbi:ribosomal protein L13e [Sphaerosporella brunnea]|uniref:Ribosomal protein L13e n=1 Tax=Sphaerosporella brunnea TaxID=1250544 RepID=A0A5J5EMQ8_9PEZI|nr:ribosomal protein L13e [Sphaerosporella brunnea]
MAIKHNQQLPSAHFRKQWQRRVRTHFDQPGRKLRRRQARVTKAAAVAPRPIDLLRPVVRCPTIRYNRRVRAGRGFTLEELKEAKISRKLALTIGIPVDHRRQNTSVESLQQNVARLNEYKSKLIIFPRKTKAPKKGDASAEEIKEASQVVRVNSLFKIDAVPAPAVTERAIDAAEREKSAFRTLRLARADKRNQGKREKRQKAKEEEAAAKKK